MKKKLLLFLSLLFFYSFPLTLEAQFLRRFNFTSPPTGTCQNNYIGVDIVAHNFYYCDQIWRKVTDLSQLSITNGAQPFGATASSSFQVVLIPDAQYAVEETNGGSHAQFTAQMNYICDNKVANNIVAAIGLGDITNNATIAEYVFASGASGYGIVDACNVPYVPTIGNHDYNTVATRTSTNFNTYFGPSTATGLQSSYQASYGGSNTNFWLKFTIGNLELGIITLEVYPRTAVINWAKDIVATNPNVWFIVSTHANVRENGSLDSSAPGATFSPTDYFTEDTTGVTYNDGLSLWNSFTSRYPNIIAVVSAHFITNCTTDTSPLCSAYRVDKGVYGNSVAQIYSNYQEDGAGGNGYLKILQFVPTTGTINVSTYSPSLTAYLNSSNNQYTIKLPPIPDSSSLHNSEFSYNSLEDGLQLYLPFSENASFSNLDYVTIDRSSNGFSGQMIGAVDGVWATGITGYGYSFPNGGQIDFGNPPALTGLTSITVAAWFKTTADLSALNTVIAGKTLGGTNGEFFIGTATSNTVVRTAIINASAVRVNNDCTVPAFNDGSWHFFVGIYDGSNVTTYFDGRICNTSAQTGVIQRTSATFRINDFGSTSGTIDEVRVWNRALSINELNALYLQAGQTIRDRGSKTLNTTEVPSADCTAAQTDTATGLTTTNVIVATFNGDVTGLTGYIPLTAGGLKIYVYPTANTVNFKVCNETAAAITPQAVTINWRAF